MPRNAKVWVPVDWARLWVSWRRGEDTPESLGGSTAVSGAGKHSGSVQPTRLRFSPQDYVVLTPLEELTPGEHSVQGWGDRARHAGVPLSPPFTVADFRLSEPPVTPSVRILEWIDEEGDGMCEATQAARLEVTSPGWMLVFEQLTALDAAPEPDAVSYAPLSGNRLLLGIGSCIPFVASETRFVRFGTLDLTGAFSGFGPTMGWHPPWRSAPTQRKSPPSILSPAKGSRGCACEMSASAGGSWAALSGLLALVLRARLRR